MRESNPSAASAAHAGLLTFVIFAAAVLAVALHRSGHTQGDDFALYLRQARSIFDGDMAAVVADNRFAVVNTEMQFSPTAYPWGWPLMLSPFVWLFDLDYDRLKLVEVAAFCLWLLFLHGIVRRRIGRAAALAVIAVIGTAPAFLAYTDQLLSEIPYLLAVAIVIWWYDRVRSRSDLLSATSRDLIALGVLAAAAFNVRREGIVLVGVVAVAQVVDLVRSNDGDGIRALGRRARRTWRPLVQPHAAFVVAAVVIQLLLPAVLFPDNDNSPGNIDDRLREFPAILTNQLGLGERPQIGLAILAVAVAGAVIGVLRRPTLDVPLVALACLSALAIGTHFREIARYWFQVTPWVVYFATAALVSLVPLLTRRRRIAQSIVFAPLLLLVAVHVVQLRDDIDDAGDFDARGAVQWGPAHPDAQPVYDAVLAHTGGDDVVAHFRARTMTLLTDRRSIQTNDINRILQNADYFAQQRDSSYSQPGIDVQTAYAMGFEEVWSDERWILWRVPPR